MPQRIRGVDDSNVSERLATEATAALIQNDTGNMDAKLADVNTNIQLGTDELQDINTELDTISSNTAPVVSATDTNNSVSVGSSSTTILSALAGRIRAFIYNDSDEDIYLSLGDAAVMNKGIGLPPNKCFPVPTEFKGAVYGICTSGGKTVTYTELS